MGISVYVGRKSFELGAASFLHCFCSTVCSNLESSAWGSRFPVLMNKLYNGKVDITELSRLDEELRTITAELKSYGPDKVIWDIERPELQPPWGNNISQNITDLSNYFVTIDGKDLFSVLFQAIKLAMEKKNCIEIT
jgi:2,3-bisphosphoglycerate-dependent phosphoglycerate mutase